MRSTRAGCSNTSNQCGGFEYSGKAWRVLGTLWLIILFVVALPYVGGVVVNAQMVKALNMDRTVYGGGFGLYVMMMGLPGPVAARMIQSYGYRNVVTLGCVLLLLGSLAMATIVSSGWQFVIAFGLLAGAGVSFGGILPAQTVVTRWFFLRRALAISVILSAIEIGGLIAPPALEALIAHDNWRLGWWAFFAFALLALFIVRSCLNERAIDALVNAQTIPNAKASASRVYKSSTAVALHEAIRTRAYWMVLFFYATIGVAWVFLMAHGVVYLQDIGYAPDQTALSLAITVLASLAGNSITGYLGDRVPPHLIAAVAAALIALGFFALLAPHGIVGLISYAIPGGLGYGSAQVCVMTMLGNYFGQESFSKTFGSILAPSTVLAALGATMGGAVYEWTNGYLPVIYAMMVLCGLAVGVAFYAGPPSTQSGISLVSKKREQLGPDAESSRMRAANGS